MKQYPVPSRPDSSGQNAAPGHAPGEAADQAATSDSTRRQHRSISGFPVAGLPFSRWLHWPILLLITVIAVTAVLTARPVAAADPSWALLQKAQQASQKLSYQGVMSVQSGRHMQSSRITHVYDPQQGEFESIETLQGSPTEWIRHNDEVQCIMHDTKTIRMDRRHASQVFSRLISARVEELAERYSISQKEGDRVAGLDCHVIELRPRDNLRYGYRMWIERESGLLLRSQMLGDSDEVLEQVGFSDIRIGGIGDRQRPRFKPIGEGWKVEDTNLGTASASPLTISLRQSVPGFRQASTALRKTRNAMVNQYVYTDGLASVSLFVEPFDPGKAQPNSVIHHGAVRSVVKRVGDWSVTAMGEVPMATVKLFVNEIDIRKP